MSTPLISVVMPVYNAAEYLDPAIHSIRSQTFPDFEFIVVDDGSTDATEEILRRHAREDNRIKILKADHQGQVPAMRVGFAAARGTFVARADSDDISLPNRFALQVDYFFKHPNIVVVGASVELIDKDGIIFDRVTHPTTPELCRRSLMRYWSCIPHSGAMIRKDAYQAIGGFRELFAPAEDYDFWLRMSEVGDIVNAPYYLLQYRVHFDNLSFRKTERQLLSVLAAHRAAQLRAEDRPDPFADSRPLSWEVLRAIGCSNDDILDCATSFATYVQWGVALGNEAAASSLLQNLLRSLNSLKHTPQAAEIIVKLVGELVHRRRAGLASRYSMMALQLCPRLATAVGIAQTVRKALRDARDPLFVEIISSSGCPNGLENAGYVDRITPIDGRGLVIEGWSPNLANAKLTVYTDLRVIRAEVQRNKREDVAAIHGAELLMSGFLITLHYEAPLRQTVSIDVVRQNSSGMQKLENCCELPLRRHDWSVKMSSFHGSCYRAAESRAN